MRALNKGTASVLTALALLITGCGTEDAGVRETGRSQQPGWKISYASDSRDAYLTDVAAVSADEGWAIGAVLIDNGMGGMRPLLLHRDGDAWKRRPLPPQLDAERGLDQPNLEASGPDNVWLFGGQVEGLKSAPFAFRWDGERWRSVAMDFHATAVTVLGPDDVWALEGRRTAHHWDGSQWWSTPLPATATALHASAPDDVWAVGFRDIDPNVDTEDDVLNQPAAMHWDGQAWKLEETPEYRFPTLHPPEETASLYRIVSVSRSEAWAWGTHTFNHGEGEEEPADEEILLRWDGSRWKKAPPEVAKACCTEPGPASDGAGGLLLGPSRHWTADGTLRTIRRPELLLGQSKKLTKADRKQRPWLKQMVPVPGTRQVWAAGHVEVGSFGDANFKRAVVVSYDMSR